MNCVAISACLESTLLRIRVHIWGLPDEISGVCKKKFLHPSQSEQYRHSTCRMYDLCVAGRFTWVRVVLLAVSSSQTKARFSDLSSASEAISTTDSMEVRWPTWSSRHTRLETIKRLPSTEGFCEAPFTSSNDCNNVFLRDHFDKTMEASANMKHKALSCWHLSLTRDRYCTNIMAKRGRTSWGQQLSLTLSFRVISQLVAIGILILAAGDLISPIRT